jgi:VIT1/CCC1 family predicted Fe2+/Mn2+ transporter
MTNRQRASIILGMHDAIVSLTGLIAGLYFASVETNIIIITCIISSISASLSMGAANYLATRATSRRGALGAATTTFFAYMITCILLISPFFVTTNRTTDLLSVFVMAVSIILGFNLAFYRNKHFWNHFLEMLGICTLVSAAAFLIGESANRLFGI